MNEAVADVVCTLLHKPVVGMCWSKSKWQGVQSKSVCSNSSGFLSDAEDGVGNDSPVLFFMNIRFQIMTL